MTVGGVVTYTFTNLSLDLTTVSSGGTVYTPAEVAIDLVAGPGLTAELTFSKSDATPGTEFFASGIELSSFLLSYDVTLAPAVPGTVAYASELGMTLEGSVLNGASASALMNVPASSCQAATPSTPGGCTIPPQPATMTIANTLTLVGNRGSAAVSSFTNVLDAAFVPAPVLGAQEIPSLSTWGFLLLAGLLAGAAMVAIRRG